MRTWTDTVYNLDEDDAPHVVRHHDSVSLHFPGFLGDSRGFSVRFVPEHLKTLCELVSALQAIARGENKEEGSAGEQ